MKPPENQRWDQETMLVAWAAALVSFTSFFHYYRRSEILLYGDAVAHIGIARRVIDSLTPGLLQLGTVWLPLPHLLMIPFLLSDKMWVTGVGGSIGSMAAFVFGALGIFRLVRGALAAAAEPGTEVRTAAWLAALIYLANPNLVYLQSTAMTEAIYLAFFIWTIVHFSEFVREGENASLMKSGWCLAAACLTRYDGWLLAGMMCAVALVLARPGGARVRQAFVRFALLAAAAPVFWLAYNAIIYRNPLEFANGPYSAKAIEQRTSTPGSAPHPGLHNLRIAESYFIKSAELNLAQGNWGRLWLLFALAGLGAGFLLQTEKAAIQTEPGPRNSKNKIAVTPAFWPLLPLATPLLFYPISIAYGGVPIFLPVWWPYSIYNARYGLQLLPAFTVLTALLVFFLMTKAANRRGRIAVVATSVVLVALSYAWVWRAQPICFREAWINSRTRIALEGEVAAYLDGLPARSTLLMYLGDHAGALERAGIPIRRVINEGNHRVWKQPSDPEGLWERALAEPEKYADYVIAMEGDPVWKAVQNHPLRPIAVIHVSGQPKAVIYRTGRGNHTR